MDDLRSELCYRHGSSSLDISLRVGTAKQGHLVQPRNELPESALWSGQMGKYFEIKAKQGVRNVAASRLSEVASQLISALCALEEIAMPTPFWPVFSPPLYSRQYPSPMCIYLPASPSVTPAPLPVLCSFLICNAFCATCCCSTEARLPQAQ